MSIPAAPFCHCTKPALSNRQIFVSVIGQCDNLGDVVLRRRLLTTLRSYGTLHLFVGASTVAYLANITRNGDMLYRDFATWRVAVLAAGKRAVLIEKPGSHDFTRASVPYRLRIGWLARRLGWLGGRSLMLGVGLQTKPNIAQRLLIAAYLVPFDLVAWRETRATTEIGVGVLMPDWAFDEAADVNSAMLPIRNRIVVSLRADRPAPSVEWLEAIRVFARRHDLIVNVACQVDRDMPRCHLLADELGATMLPWLPDEMAQSEAILRAAYARAALVVSDRLHVLILAATEGAPVACLLDFAEHKINRHFEAIGYFGASETVADLDVDARVARMEHHCARSDELRVACVAARDAIVGIEHRIRTILA